MSRNSHSGQNAMLMTLDESKAADWNISQVQCFVADWCQGQNFGD